MAEQITPFLPLLGVIAGALTVGGFSVWNRWRNSKEVKAPTVNEAWLEAENARQRTEDARARGFAVEDLYYALRSAFRSFARRAIEAHPDLELSASERATLEAQIPDSK